MPLRFRIAACILVFATSTAVRAEVHAVQVGVFADQSRLRALQETLEAAGYPCYIVLVGESARLRVGPYRDAGSARSEATALRHFLVARYGASNISTPWVVSEGRSLVDEALGYLDTPYRWGGMSGEGFDCSGFTSFIFGRQGVALPRRASDQFQGGEAIDPSDLKPGDLVFFSTSKAGPSHVGIFAGNGEFLHASSGSGKIVLTPLDSPYYDERYLGARRY